MNNIPVIFGHTTKRYKHLQVTGSPVMASREERNAIWHL
jgi:hypothetical protein